MVSKGNAQRKLAFMIALALSTGGGCLTTVDGGMMWGASTAHAAEHVYAETATNINGLEGTDKTHSMNDNKITLGTEGGSTDKPFSTWGTISGGGKKNATEDVSNNTLTIHGLKVSNGSGQSMIYGGVSGTGAVTSNHVVFNNGLSKDPIYGGFNGASATKAVTGNSVTVAGGTVEGDAFGGVTQGTGAVTGNSVTITDGTLKDEAGGGVVTNASNSSDVTGNTLTISGGTFSKGNTNVYGAYTAGNGDVSGNTVAVSGGIIGTSAGGNIHGGYSDGSGTVSGNTVTISGGTLGGQAVLTTSGKIYGGYSGGTGKTINNVVNLGTAEGVYTAGTGMKRVEVYGGNRTSDVTGNALHVYAKGVEVEKIRNFESYNFHLTAPIKAGNTMLTLGSGNLGSGADWNKLNLDLSGWAVDTTKYGKIGTVTLMHSNSGSDIVFNNYAAKTGSSGDFEYNITATPSMLFPTRTLTTDVTAEVNRFQNVDATADNVTGTEVYGGYSSLGHTTTNNKLKVTALPTAGHLTNVYGGYTAGAGDSTDNHVTVSLANRTQQITGRVVGGTAATEKAAIMGNTVTIEGGSVNQGAIGGLGTTVHKGDLKNNTVTIRQDGAVALAYGAFAEDGGAVVGGDSAADGNHAVIEGGRAEFVIGGATNGTGKMSYNTVTVSGGEVGSAGVNNAGGAFGGASMGPGAGNVTHNSVTIAGGKIEGSVYGGYAVGTGNVTNNSVTIAGGRFENAGTAPDVYGGYAVGTGKTTGNTVSLGDAEHTDLRGAALSSSAIYGGNKTDVTGNTLSVYGKNVAVKSVNNFESYDFKLNKTLANNDVMLTVQDAGDFAGTGVDWSKIAVDRSAIDANYLENIHGVRRVELLKSATPNALHFKNYAVRNFGATDTHESALMTDQDKDEATSVVWVVNRFKGGRVAFDGTAESEGGELYGGISYDGHTTTDNALTITGVHGANDPKYAFGGKNDGDTGDVTNNTVTVDMAHAADVVEEVYGGQASSEDHAGKVEKNTVNMKQGTTAKLYGGYTFGKGAVTENTVNFEGGESTGYVVGGYLDNEASMAEARGNKVVFTHGTAAEIDGADSTGQGALKENGVVFGGAGSTAAVLRGAIAENKASVEENYVIVTAGTVGSVYGGATYATDPTTKDLIGGDGHARENTVTISGGTVTDAVYGGLGYRADGNTVTISGGTFGTAVKNADVYGGMLTGGPGSGTVGNTVNLGAEDGAYAADLSYAKIHGGSEADGNTLRIRGKGITVLSADNFDKYDFQLRGSLADGDTLLTLKNGGFGREIDWQNNFVVDTSKLKGVPSGAVTLLKSDTANALTFKNYATRDHSTGNTEYFIGTNTGTDTATSVLMNYSIFQDNAWTYDGTNPATANEVVGGASYRDGHTTYNNKITVTGVPAANLNFVCGGKTNGAADSKENWVIVESTDKAGGQGAGSIANINGGFTAKADGAASANHVIIKGGTVTNVVGGAVSGANASAKNNEVRIEGGTVTSVIGGGGTAASAGNMSENTVTITGGTVSRVNATTPGYVVGGDSRVLTSLSRMNVINLGDDKGNFTADLSNAQLWGTSYNGNVFANDSEKIAGNTLNVKAKSGATIAQVRNIEKFNFQLHDDTTKNAPLLTLTNADGFGHVSAGGTAVQVKWDNVAADLSKITTEKNAAKIQGKNTYVAMRAANPSLKFSDYAKRFADHAGVYETALYTDSGTGTAAEVRYDVNRFKDGVVTYTTTSAGDALGGYSAYGHTTEQNALTVTGVPGAAGAALAAAYGGQTAGETGGSVHNTVTIEGTNTAAGAGSVTDVYGGAITNAANTGDAVKNTVALHGGTVGTVYGGYTAGTGKTTGNTVEFHGGTVTGTIYGGSNATDVTDNTLDVKGVRTAGDIKNFEKLHFDTSMTNADETILTLNGGARTVGLDWHGLDVKNLTEERLQTLTSPVREEIFSLMANDQGLDFGTTYDKAKEKTIGDYEYTIAKENAPAGSTAEKVVVRGFRFQNNEDAVYDTGNNHDAWGGRSIIGNTVQRNKLQVRGGTLGNAYGGRSAAGVVTGNRLVLAGGTVGKAYGGLVESQGKATRNIVDVLADTHAAEIYGGHAANGEASGNSVNIGAINLHADVYGGAGAVTDGNIVHLFGTKLDGTVAGGTAANGRGNVLAIHAAGTEIKDFTGIQNLRFYLPESVTPSTAPMLTLTDVTNNKDIRGLGVSLDISGAAKHLQKDEAFRLLKTAAGGSLTTDEKIKSEIMGRQGVSLAYKFSVQKNGADELVARVESVGMSEATKSLVETRAAAMDVLGSGLNLLADSGLVAAVDAAAANVNTRTYIAPVDTARIAPDAKAAAAANVQSGAYTTWAAQGGGAMRIHSGSYVDTHGYALNVGFARKQEAKDGTLTFGPFVEYGRTSYDSHLEDAYGTRGDGKVNYLGLGVLAKKDLKSGAYLEGSLRAGRVKSDYTGDIAGAVTSYDISSPYYALHLGVGKKIALKKGDAIDAYLKYFFSHQNATSATLSTGETYDFDAVNSHRLRLGARYMHDMGRTGKFYAGLAWEYEFEGEARAAYQGMATPSPSLKGSSVLLELGYRFAPKDSRVSYDVNISGWQGKREGFMGSVGVNWAF